jgi:tetratricopeptide (TPR) repeat protein
LVFVGAILAILPIGVIYGLTMIAAPRPGGGDFDAGRASIQSGEEAGAIALLEETTQAEPGNAEAFYALGKAHYQAGNFPAARDALSEALRLDPTNEQILLAFALLGKAAGFDPGDYLRNDARSGTESFPDSVWNLSRESIAPHQNDAKKF